jgi:hypothetical protein
LNQGFKGRLVLAVNADRLTVPVNPDCHVNTINRCGAGDNE